MRAGFLSIIVRLKALTAVGLIALAFAHQGQADTSPPLRHEINKGVVEIISGSATSSSFAMTADIARAATNGNELRVIANVGLGSFQNIQDLLYLRGIDVALVNAAVLDFYRDKNIIPGLNLDNHVRYVAPIYGAEFQILARDDIRTIYDLNGRKVNFGTASASANMVASLVFGSLGISPQVLNDSHPVAIEKLLAGEIDAISISTGKPWKAIANIKRSDGVHFLDVPADAITGSFYPAELTANDYPNLIAAGDRVATVSNDLIMAVYNWPVGHPRRINLERFEKAFFASLDKLREGETYHPKWRTIDAYRDVPGWRRFESSQPDS